MSPDVRPRLLMVGNFLSSSRGTRGVCEDLSEALEELGWSVIRTSQYPGKIRRLLDKLSTALVRRGEYDCAVVDVYSGAAFTATEVLCFCLRRLGKPYLLTLRGGGLAEYSRKHLGRVDRLMKGASVVMTPSRFLQSALTNKWSAIHYLPDGLTLGGYAFSIKSRPAPRLAWLRAFDSTYNPLMAIRAVALLREEYPDLQLTMYGPDLRDGSLEAVKALIGELGLERAVAIPGPVPKKEVPGWLSRHDIFLNTTRFESFGVCVVEAAACGLPIVTTDVGELPYMWTNNEDALLVPDNGAEEMAAAVRRLIAEPGLAERLSLAARAKVERFDWSYVLPEWEKILADMPRG